MRVSFFLSPWQSGEIRGRQIAGELEKRAFDVCIDPKVVYRNDTCVFIKCVPPDEVVNRQLSRTLIDVVDAYGMMPWLKEHPTVELIAISDVQAKLFKDELPGRKIWTIPEHYCNFEDARVEVRRPKWVGYIGCLDGFQLDVADVTRELKRLGMNFIFLETPFNRDAVCQFYRQIDLQLCFRKESPYPEFKNPLKLANAGSFGIPTIAYPEPADEEFGRQNYIQVSSLEEAISYCSRLKDDEQLYRSFSSRALAASNAYGIAYIINRWLKVLDGTVDSL